MERNCTPASPATALASRVLPVPGGPTSSTPLGILAPRSRYFLGSWRKLTISRSSSFSSSAPATSVKLTFSLLSDPKRMRALPNRLPWSMPPPPWALAIIYCQIRKMIPMRATYTSTSIHQGGVYTGA